MRIGRFNVNGRACIGRFEDEQVVDISSAYSNFREAMRNPGKAESVDGKSYSPEEITYLPVTTESNTIFCAALNYKAHAEEGGTSVPNRPYIFMKLPRTVIGHRQPINYHTAVTGEIDYEAELAAVIGESARHVETAEALDHVAGYTILNDTSARDLQFGLKVGEESHLDWFSGKTMQATTPLGPHVVVDEIDDPQSLHITSRVNGETMQDDNTGMMIQSVAELVSYISSRVRLEPGDVIATGTPEGVGTFQDIQLYPDDTVEIAIENVGTLVNSVKEASE